jgi:hypothetical protein
MQSTIFLDTEFPTFTIPTPASNGSIAYKVVDRSGTTIVQGQTTVRSKQTILALQRLANDYYVLTITDHTALNTPIQTIPFTVVAPFTHPIDGTFGVSAHLSEHDPLDIASALVTMGTSMVRDDATWAKIETTKGVYNFAPIDTYMHVYQQSNISPLLILAYNNPFYDDGLTPHDSVGFTAFANYAKALVSHYGPELKAVEVYNEYNVKFSNGPAARDPGCYAQMLKATYQAIKSICPDVTVVVGATFCIDLGWFDDLFATGALAYTDVISVHPYSFVTIDSDTPEFRGIAKSLQSLQELIKTNNHGQTKPIWITELGWSNAFNITNELEQAHYLVRSIALSLSVGVQKFFWYDLLNDGTDKHNLEQNFGLLRRPDAAGYYTPKPAYTAYAVLVRLLANRSFVGRQTEEFDVYHMRFSDNLHIIWSTPLHQKIELATNGPITAISITGKKQTLTPTDGKVTIHLTSEPVYIQTDTADLAIHALTDN